MKDMGRSAGRDSLAYGEARSPMRDNGQGYSPYNAQQAQTQARPKSSYNEFDASPSPAQRKQQNRLTSAFDPKPSMKTNARDDI